MAHTLIPCAGTLCQYTNFTPLTFSEYEAHNSKILCLHHYGSNTAYFRGYTTRMISEAGFSTVCFSTLLPSHRGSQRRYVCSLLLAPQLITRACSKLTEIDSVSRNHNYSSRLPNTGFHPPLSFNKR